MSSAAPESAAVAIDRRFPITGKQILSIMGLVPLGIYVFVHLWNNMYSVSPALFDQNLVESHNNPAMIFLEFAGIGVPLLLHIVVGFKILLAMRPNNVRWNTFRNLKYLLQRLSAIGVLLFLGAHILKARILPATTPLGHETWAGMHEALSEPVTFTVYALGILGIAYHLANGIWSSTITLGLVSTPRGMKRMEWVSAWAFVILLAMGATAIWGFRPFQS